MILAIEEKTRETYIWKNKKEKRPDSPTALEGGFYVSALKGSRKVIC